MPSFLRVLQAPHAHPLYQAVAGKQKKIEEIEIYRQLIDFESDEWHVAHAKILKKIRW